MNTREKIDRAADTAVLCLHKEGIFYKLYNQHAMLFTQNIKQLKVKARFIKTVNQQVYSCGFPCSILEEIKERLVGHGGVLEQTEKLLIAANVKWATTGKYSLWCEQQQEASAGPKKGTEELTPIEQQIAAFQVMRKTPMEAMDFILELQEQLNGSHEC